MYTFSRVFWSVCLNAIGFDVCLARVQKVCNCVQKCTLIFFADESDMFLIFDPVNRCRILI